MKRRDWSLDIQFPDFLFERNWPVESNLQLLKIFKALDLNSQPMLSMLPPGVTPAGAAVAASLYFLPTLPKPPKPHSRIALFPGLHFVRQIEQVQFDPAKIWKATQKARAKCIGYQGLEGPLDKLRISHLTATEVYFHWLFRCSRIWTRHLKYEAIELVPRGYYGRGDPYESAIDFIESDNLELFSDKYNPYDLLIYCPHFHSRISSKNEEDYEQILKKIVTFHADRKLIVARSPFDFWSRKIEEKTKIIGVALPLKGPIGSNSGQGGVKFIIVDQIISLSESYFLFEEIKISSKKIEVEKELINELKTILRRLLISLDPNFIGSESPLNDLGWRLRSLGEALGFSEDGLDLLEKIQQRISNGNFKTKIEVIREILSDKSCEVWVTKDLDRTIMESLKSNSGSDVLIKMVDRWTSPGIRNSGRIVVLTRIDREGDLDLTAYLLNEDIILMSSWEAVIRNATIMSSWVRSERWRENAVKLGIVEKVSQVSYADPVLDLANHLDNLISEEVQKQKGESGLDTSVVSWWDDQDNVSILDLSFERNALTAKTGATVYQCKEVHFENNFGMFLKVDEDVQVIKGSDDDSEICATAISNLKVGSQVILFKDAERNSLFDILIDHLERSSEFSSDAKMVRNWKTRLREHVDKNDISISDVAKLLVERNRSFENITIRSWVYGATMAPQKVQDLTLLIEVLKIKDLHVKSLFSSVKKLRTIARILGKALNEILLSRSLENIDPKTRQSLLAAGLDIEELSTAIETRVVHAVQPQIVEIEGKNTGKLFKIQSQT